MSDNIEQLVDLLNELKQNTKKYDDNLTQKLVVLSDMLCSNAEIRDEKFTDLQNKLGQYFSDINKITEETEIKIGNSISELSDLKNEIKSITNALNGLNYGNEKPEIIDILTTKLDEITNSFSTLQSSIQSGIHEELTNNTEFLEKQINDLIDQIKNIKIDFSSDVFDSKVPYNEIEEKITAVKQEINLVNTDLVDVITSRSQAIVDELLPLKSSLEALSFSNVAQSNGENCNNAKELFDEINIIKKLIEEKFQNVKQTNEMKTFISSTTEDAKNSLLYKIDEKSDYLKSMLSDFSKTEDLALDKISIKINEVSKKHNAKIENVNENLTQSCDKILNLLDTLNNKSTNYEGGFDSEILTKIDDIKNVVLAIQQNQQDQQNLAKTIDDTSKVDKVQTNLENLIKQIDEKQTNDLNKVKKDILTVLISVFENISIIEEAEDIKDFIEDRTDELSQGISDVKQHLIQISNPIDSNYTYSLQDIESDIAKLRLVLKDISNSSSNKGLDEISDNIHKIVSSVETMQNSLTDEQIFDLKSNFERLSEDILSISSRTNKLLLTSDESYQTLNNGLNEFNNVINKLEERISILDNSETTKQVDHKLDTIFNVVRENSNSDRVMRQSLTYVGEWIDKAEENLNCICEQSAKIDNVSQIIDNLQEKMPEHYTMLQSLQDKFEEQQVRMDRLEMKLDKILSALEDIDDSKMVRKIDKLDKQISKFSTDIGKIVSYVDE